MNAQPSSRNESKATTYSTSADFPNWKNIQVHHTEFTKKFIMSPLLASLHINIPLLTHMDVHNKTVEKRRSNTKKGTPLQENQHYAFLRSNTYFIKRKLPT